MSRARKIVLPRLVVTEVSNASDIKAIRVPLADAESGMYFVRPVLDDDGMRINGQSSWCSSRFNLFPVVLGADGTPWAEATVYLLSRVEGVIAPVMSTYSGIADDLAAFRCFLDEKGIDWTQFPRNKNARPTYRFNGYLLISMQAGEIKVTTAKRRMSTVIAFYSWLRSEGVLVTENVPWKEKDQYIELKNSKGFKFSKPVTSTDLSIPLAHQVDPYDDHIYDGGKLRPLTMEEQGWVLEALIHHRNTEMTLIHLFALLTGARIQTILTLRVRHTLFEIGNDSIQELRLPVGQGTGIDTKYNKQLVLHIPFWFYRMLQTYARSARAQRRRIRAIGGNTEDQYLFLSVRGSPLYRSKAESAVYNDDNLLRYEKTGQGVRQFIVERIIPHIKKHHNSAFKYQFHDTRATFGMNLTDHLLEQVARGEITLHQAREFVKTRMGHESAATTDNYLRRRSNLKFVRQVNSDYDAHLRALAVQIGKDLKCAPL